jgi:hypothetical protein
MYPTDPAVLGHLATTHLALDLAQGYDCAGRCKMMRQMGEHRHGPQTTFRLSDTGLRLFVPISIAINGEVASAAVISGHCGPVTGVQWVLPYAPNTKGTAYDVSVAKYNCASAQAYVRTLVKEKCTPSCRDRSQEAPPAGTALVLRARPGTPTPVNALRTSST